MYRATKQKVHGLLHPEIVGDKHWDKIINLFIVVLIILNVIVVMLETVDPLFVRYRTFFYYFDLFSVIIFTIEYVLRLWSATEEERYKHPLWGRLKYMVSAGALIDLIAILPFFIYMFTAVPIDLRELRILRLLRVLRLFRLTAYTQAAQMIGNVFRKRKSELTLSFVLATFLIIISSCIIYFAEHRTPAPGETASKFTSIPATLWWSVVTLTTTGYGDIVPVTHVGKFLTGFIMLAGVAFFALPAGIITAGFIDEFRLLRVKRTHRCPHCGEMIEFEDKGNHIRKAH
ncbi:MAG TPA: ion transporter [Chitinophagaceae bacterium]|nr:ion transporter [Chitinophagaceae bacterium]